MKECKRRSSKKGYILMGLGAIMLLGLLNLGFLIPFAIAVFLIMKGWKLINGSQRLFPEKDMVAGSPSRPIAYTDVDPLDEWEKELNSKKN